MNYSDTILEELKKTFTEEQIMRLLENEKLFSKIVNKALLELQLREEKTNFYKFKKENNTAAKMLLTKNMMGVYKNPKYLYEAGDIPNYSTGINVLEDLLTKIVPGLQKDYRKLTTSIEQRKSFRNHVINAVINWLQSPRMYAKDQDINPDAVVDRQKKLEDDNSNFSQIENDIESDVKTGNESEKGKFININKGGESVNKKKDEEYNLFYIDGEDKTGANLAFESFKKIKKQILDSYNMLDNEEDKKIFYEYLIVNLKLHMDRFEEELRYDLPKDKVEKIDQFKPEGEMKITGEVENSLNRSDSVSANDTNAFDF